MAKKDIQLKILDRDNSVEKYEVSGFENLVPEIRKIDQQIEELQKRRVDMRDLLMSHVRNLKKDEESNGKLFKTFVIKSGDGVPANILFKNAYSKLDIENEDIIKSYIGEYFDQLFSHDKSVTLKRKANVDNLKNILGKRFDEFFDTKHFLCFAKDFMEKHMAIRTHLSKKANAMLDKWTYDNQAQPDLRMKG